MTPISFNRSVVFAEDKKNQPGLTPCHANVQGRVERGETEGEVEFGTYCWHLHLSHADSDNSCQMSKVEDIEAYTCVYVALRSNKRLKIVQNCF